MVAYKSLSSRKDLKPKYAQKYRFLPTVLKASLAYCGAVCVYYAVVEEPISTVAHACALAMGGFIGYFFTRSTDDVASDGLKHDIERKPK